MFVRVFFIDQLSILAQDNPYIYLYLMTRSKEALVRRAAKRGLPVPALVRQSESTDMPQATKKIKTEHKTVDIHKNKTAATIDNKLWFCSKCKNRNLSALSAIRCNRCQRDRSEVEEYANTADIAAPIVSPTVLSSKEQSDQGIAQVPIHLAKKIKPISEKTSEKIENRAWAISAPSAADLEKNQYLREAYVDLEKRSALSVEDLERAQLLVARSERKKEKKQAMKRPGYRFSARNV